MPNRKSPVAMPALGRGQAARPGGPPVTREGERALAGAMSVPIEQIVPDPGQPRRDHGAETLTALATSLTDYGVLQPLRVREAGTLDDGRTRYMIVAGGRRYAAALLAGLTRLPVVVKDTEGAALRLTQLVENIQRQDLAPLEEARAFQELMDAENLNAEGVGERLSISGQKVRDRLLLLTDQVVSDAVQRQQIPMTVATEILRLPDEGRAQLRASIEDGASPDRAAVRQVRDNLKAAGVANLRAKGGGRAKRAPQDVPPTVTEGDHYQKRIDNDGDAARPVEAVDGLESALGPLDVATRATVARVARFGAGEGWSCAQLLAAIEAAGANAK